MARLIVAFLILAIVIMALAVLTSALRPVHDATTAGIQLAKREAQMPDRFQKIAYVLLIMLMIGVATGWVGSL